MSSSHEGLGEQCLTAAQLEALRHVRASACSRQAGARRRLNAILDRGHLSPAAWAEAMESLRRHAQVVLHFHPDRLTAIGRSVAEGLLADGVYRSQYETRISSGSPTAYAGGLRDTWEASLFGGAYHAPGVAAGERPKYGALGVFHYADGASPRFGSCYLVLHPAVSTRCTFSYGDSVTEPEHVGTLDAMDDVLAALLDDIEAHGCALGRDGLSVPGFVEYLCDGLPCHDDPASWPMGRVLDAYIEAQVHGSVDLKADVARLVADPSFRDTATGEHLETACRRYGIALSWHPGFTLPAESVPDDFRGPAMPPLARRIAEMAGTDVLDAATIGVAAASLHRQPEAWREWGSHEDVLRLLRQLWHVLVRYGVSSGSGRTSAGGARI